MKNNLTGNAAGGNEPLEDDNRPGHEEIARRAYEIHLEHGGADGHDLDDWLAAEQELLQDRSPQAPKP